jgi:putative transposase
LYRKTYNHQRTVNAAGLKDRRARNADEGGGLHPPYACYFFTVNLADRRREVLIQHIGLLGAAFRQVRARHPFTIEAAVILPDHLHAIWTLPDGDADLARRRRLIKSGFSHGLPGGERISGSGAAKGERGIWQRRYWEHTLRDEDDFVRHLDYIHFNPVKHGHAARVRDWPYSSFRRWVRLGAYPEDWADDPGRETIGFR